MIDLYRFRGCSVDKDHLACKPKACDRKEVPSQQTGVEGMWRAGEARHTPSTPLVSSWRLRRGISGSSSFSRTQARHRSRRSCSGSASTGGQVLPRSADHKKPAGRAGSGP
jgi:hypothetical protein